MDHTNVHFAMRLVDSASLEEVATRRGRAPRCTFALSQDPRDAWDTMLAEVLCLRLSLTYWPPDVPRVPGKSYMYTFTGRSVEAQPWGARSDVDRTEWMLAKLRLLDSHDWYVPTLEELRAEVIGVGSGPEPEAGGAG